MKIFIDFDDVLFDTREFVIDYKKIFKSYGINEKIYDKYYYNYPANKNKSFKKYNSKMHVREIGKNFPINARKIEKNITNFIKNTRKYIFKDVYKFVNRFSKKDLYIISFPKIGFQETKIKNSGINKYFEKSISTSGLKSKIIKNLIKKNEIVYFIDDRLESVENVKKKIPSVVTILLGRKEGRHKYSGKGNFDFRAVNLREVFKIINKNLCAE
ncbi:MAG TPA: HAD hydrolase-like protein [Candidatus Moranbacteria bacterium]|nr:HAD hydrolase-like protein [Candidatus Moranbacteria bacterium]